MQLISYQKAITSFHQSSQLTNFDKLLFLKATYISRRRKAKILERVAYCFLMILPRRFLRIGQQEHYLMGNATETQSFQELSLVPQTQEATQS